jgi:hypothetical protein
VVRVHVDTTRKYAALRQIRGAITCLHDVDYECAVTLAHAAEGMIADEKQGGGKYLFQLMKERLPDDDHNLFCNWLKHDRPGDKARITVFEVVVMIARAIHKFIWYYQESSDHFNSFQKWALLHGHLPKPISEGPAQESAA